MTSCVVYHVMQVLGCKIISHMWPNVRSTCLCVYVKPMSYFKFTLIHMFVIDLQVHIYVSWFSLCCKFTYMYVDLVYVASSHLWYSCWLFCKFTPMMFILTMPKMPSLHLCHVYVNEFLYANFVYVKLG